MGKRKRSGSFTKTDDSGAKKSDDCDSQEELDGDTLIPLKNSNGVRCSARVQEKQEKLRREASPSKQTVLDVNVQTPGSNATSSTIIKSNKRPVFPDEFDILSTEELTVRLKLNAKDKRKKRTWELWSLEDKQLFFEALNEHGKDFDAIQNYFATKLKPKSKAGQCLQPLSKNKDQVRHFYYRTWNKISKYLQFPKDMKKAFQELYGLVNYGELRKKLRVLNSKTAVKLSELVQKGTTAIKVRGKTFRIKTPVCRALKRLNRLEDIEHSRVPCKISLELIPKNGKAWAAVQGVSHNPRVKAYVPLQRTLASVITYFEDKWKSKTERLKQEMAYTFGGKPVPKLRIFPLDTNDVNLPIFKLSENTSSAKISLRSYTENVLSKEIDEELELCTKKLKRRRKQSECCGPGGSQSGIFPGNYSNLNNGSEAYDSQAEADASDIDTPDAMPLTDALPNKVSEGEQLIKQLYGASDDDGQLLSMSRFVRLINLAHNEEQSTTNRWNSFPERPKTPVHLEIATEAGNNVDTATDVDEPDNLVEDGLPESGHLAQICSVCSSKGGESEDMLAHVWDEENILRGWTAAEAGVMTVGELYLMMGKCEKLCFEYCWDQPEEICDRTRINRMLEKLIGLASSLKKKKSARTKSVAGVVPSGVSPCTNCGFKDPGNPVIVLNPALNIPIKPNSIPHPNFKGTRISTTELQPPVSTAVTLASCVEPVVTNMVFSSTSVPVPIFSSVPKAVRTILPSPISMSTDLPHPSSATKSNKLLSCDAISAVQQMLTTAVSSPSPVISDLPPDSHDDIDLKKPEGFALATPLSTKTGALENNNAAVPDATIVATEEVEVTSIDQTPIVSQSVIKVNDEKPSDASNFRRPGQVSIRSEVSDQKTTPPKPFLDLPKGNRRLGRKPNWKRMVIPRELPLLPKFTVPSPVISLSPASVIMSTANSQILIPLGQPLATLSTVSTEVLVSSIGTNISPVSTNDINSPKVITQSINISPSVSTEKISLPKVTGHNILSRRITPTALPQTANSIKKKLEMTAGTSKRNFPVSSTSSDTGAQQNICDEILNVKSISTSSGSFDDLLKVRQQDAQNAAADMESNLSLSSFMEISLPESTKLDANEFTADRFLDDMTLDNSLDSNLSISDFQERGTDLVLAKSTMSRDISEFFQNKKKAKETLQAPKKIPSSSECSRSQSPSFPSQIQSFLDNQWSEPGDLSLSSLLGSLEPIRSTTTISEIHQSEFQSMLTDSSQDVDFSSRFSEIISDSNSLGNKVKK